jgi:hypothetical protein
VIRAGTLHHGDRENNSLLTILVELPDSLGCPSFTVLVLPLFLGYDAATGGVRGRSAGRLLPRVLATLRPGDAAILQADGLYTNSRSVSTETRHARPEFPAPGLEYFPRDQFDPGMPSIGMSITLSEERRCHKATIGLRPCNYHVKFQPQLVSCRGHKGNSLFSRTTSSPKPRSKAIQQYGGHQRRNRICIETYHTRVAAFGAVRCSSNV